MNTNMHSNTVDQVISAIHTLDLDPIKLKLMDAEEGHGWSRAYADHTEIEYKRFLTLLVKYPQASIAPSKDVDKFWHGHILDTMKYAEDCNNVFGYFLHHFPYFGMRGAEDAANLVAAGSTMQQLYQQEFGAARSTQDNGWCAATVSTAWCAASGHDVEAKTAWCAASGHDVEAKTAWCAASGHDVEAKTAWCAASTRIGNADILNTSLRPTLPPCAR